MESYFFGVDSAQGAKSLNDPKLVAYADTEMKKGFNAQRVGQLKVVGDVGILTYQFGNETMTIILKLYYKIHDGKTLNLVAITRSDLAEKRTATLMKMMQTFSKGKAELDQNLQGSWYREGGSHSGGVNGQVYTSHQEYIILAADGSAQRKTKGAVSVNTPRGGANDWDNNWNVTKGTWSARNGQLTLIWDDGQVFSAAYKIFMHEGAPAVKVTPAGAEKPLYYKKTG